MNKLQEACSSLLLLQTLKWKRPVELTWVQGFEDARLGLEVNLYESISQAKPSRRHLRQDSRLETREGAQLGMVVCV